MKKEISCNLLAGCLVGLLAATAAAGEIETDVCVVGGGSGGVSTALAAARAGVRVVLVERLSQLGGTSTSAYVSSWEPGPGDGFARELYDRLCRIDGVGITSDQNPDRKQGPFGLWLIMPQVSYEETLHRAGTPYGQCHGVVFDPEKMSRTMADLLGETGRCQVLFNTRFISGESEGRKVMAIKAESKDGTVYYIRAKVFVDATGNVDLARSVGCETMSGAEPKSRFGEPSAPEEAGRTLNAISLCYRIRKAGKAVEPPVQKVIGFPHSAHVTALPGGGFLVNPLGVLPGEALMDQGYEKAYSSCQPIAAAHWQWLHTFPQFADCEFVDFAPMLGIRESYRVVGEHVLTQHDLSGGKHPDIIALADHPMDVHGSGRGSTLTQVRTKYGIPYRCLVPRDKDNLLVACRGASFSHIAASSCRLSRTMLAIGHAAGLAAAQSVKTGGPVGRVNVAAIQNELRLAVPPGDIRGSGSVPDK